MANRFVASCSTGLQRRRRPGFYWWPANGNGRSGEHEVRSGQTELWGEATPSRKVPSCGFVPTQGTGEKATRVTGLPPIAWTRS